VCECRRARFYECVYGRGFNKRRLECVWECRDDLQKDRENESSLCTREILVCVCVCVCVYVCTCLECFSCLGGKTALVLGGKVRKADPFHAQYGENDMRQKFAVDLRGNATASSLTSHLFWKPRFVSGAFLRGRQVYHIPLVISAIARTDGGRRVCACVYVWCVVSVRRKTS